MIDSIEGLKVMVSGSSAFELNNQIGEPFVGSITTFQLFTSSQLEFSAIENYLLPQANLEERLIFGSCPELLHLNNQQDKIDYLKNLIHSYLLKDIRWFEGKKKQGVMLALLQKLAFRSSSEIRLEALRRELQISKNTVEKYLDLFKKILILYNLKRFCSNGNGEITKMKKWYFVDNGIRCALFNTFNQLTLRDDVSTLGESYLNFERTKRVHYEKFGAENYF